MNKIIRITTDFPQHAGVYRITNIDKFKTYIGSSRDLKSRIVAHDSDLRLGYTSNKEMLGDFRNGDRFIFEVLKFFSEKEVCRLSEWEQHYINSFHSKELGYNLNNATVG